MTLVARSKELSTASHAHSLRAHLLQGAASWQAVAQQRQQTQQIVPRDVLLPWRSPKLGESDGQVLFVRVAARWADLRVPVRDAEGVQLVQSLTATAANTDCNLS